MASSLKPGGSISVGGSLVSGNSRYILLLQTDGNLVIYQGNSALWSSRTNGKVATAAVLQRDGNFVLYERGGAALWSSRTNGQSITGLVMQNDGNLVLYRTDGTAAWASNTNQPADGDGPLVFARKAYCCTMFRGGRPTGRRETIYELNRSRAEAECRQIADFYRSDEGRVKEGEC